MPGKYQRIIEWVFRKRVEELEEEIEGSALNEDIPFHRDDIEEAMDKLDINIGNVPDIPYAYRSRRPLPESLTRHGYSAVIIDDTRAGEDPTYMFTKRDQLIPVPDVVDGTHQTSVSALPDAVRPYIGEDEQGVLTQMRYAGLLDDFSGLDTYHLTSHLRFRVRGREAELDDLYIGVDEEATHHALAVEAKGESETLNSNQLIRNTRGIEAKDSYPNSVRTFAVKLYEGDIFLFEFDVFEEEGQDRVKSQQVWRYEFMEDDL